MSVTAIPHLPLPGEFEINLDQDTVGPVTLVNGIATTVTTIAATYGSVWWHVEYLNGSGNRYQCDIRASLNSAGTGANWDENGPDDGGIWTGSTAVTVSGGNFNLQATAPASGWTAYAIRMPFLGA